jgi:undecaprenyl-diphosphatase
VRPAVDWLRSHIEVGTLAGLLIVVPGLQVLGWLAFEAIDGSTAGFDAAFPLALRNPADLNDPIGPAAFEEFMCDFSALAGIGILTLITAAGCGLMWLQGRHRTAPYLLVRVVGGAILGCAFKMLIDRPHPHIVPHATHVGIASFPSDHAMMATVDYLTIAAPIADTQFRRGLKANVLGLAIGLTLLVGVARVYLGVHFPPDILAGWALGSAWAMACWSGANQIDQCRKTTAATGKDRLSGAESPEP